MVSTWESFDKTLIQGEPQKVPEKKALSLVIITFNEESNIERCIKSVPFADEVIVVDSFSTDCTVDIAKSMGAKVTQEKWRGYGPQKAYATDLAKNSWVLSLDADEALSPELAAEIQSKLETLDPEAGYLIPRRSFHMGRWIDHGGWRPDYQLRLFNKAHSHWNSAELHEKVEVKRKAYLRQSILHWVFKDLSHQVVTNDRYSTLGAEEWQRKGKGFSYFKLFTKPPTKFVECYVFKKGFLDGLPGFIIAVGAAYSVFLKWAKLWELERVKRNS